MADSDPSLSVELTLPFITIRANNVALNFRRRARSAGPFLIVSRTSGLALDATWGTASGTKPHQYGVHGLPHQLWYLRPAGKDGQVHIVSASNKLALDSGAGTGEHYSPELSPVGPEAWKRWTIEASPSGREHVFRSCASGLVLDVPWESKSETCPVMYTSHGGENQQWIVSLPVAAAE